MLKVIVVGDNATGKTSIIKRCAIAVVSLPGVTPLRDAESNWCAMRRRVFWMQDDHECFQRSSQADDWC